MLDVGETVRGDEVKVFIQELFDVVIELVEGIGGVCIAGDDDVASGTFEAGLVGPSVALARLDDSCGSL